jgi:hypothetical protein
MEKDTKIEKSDHINTMEKLERNGQDSSEIISKLVHPVKKTEIFASQDFQEGILYYAFNSFDGLMLIDSKQNIHTIDGSPNSIAVKSLPTYSNLEQETVIPYIENSGQYIPGCIDQPPLALYLYNRIKSHLTKYIFFKNRYHPTILSLWLIGTYVFSIFRYYPYLHINAEKGSGKTLLMEIMKEITFNGEMSSNVTEAVLFRKVHNNRCSLFLDEVEDFAKSDSEYHKAMLRLLNAGFNCSGTVTRSIQGGKGLDYKDYSVYSPKCFAGIGELNNILKSRTIPIYLLKKKSSENVRRYKLNAELRQVINKIKQDCYLFGLKYTKTINNFYQKSDHWCTAMPEGLGNRELDIFEPLFVIPEIIERVANYRALKTNVNENLKTFIIEFLQQRLEDDSMRNDTSMVLRMFIDMINSKKITPVKELDAKKYYDRDDVWDVIRNHYRDLFPAQNTRNKMVHLINRTLKLLPRDYLHLPSKKQYCVEDGYLEDLFERYLS